MPQTHGSMMERHEDTDDRRATVLAAALRYAEMGWNVLPLVDGKKPRLKDWPHKATTDAEIIERWWQDWPDDNLGVKLGPDSGIIDIECDSAEEERELTALFGPEGFPVTPTFQSSRGRHRLFRWRTGLPEPTKAVIKCGGIAIRTGNGDKGAQSVFPPSLHPSGVEYRWLLDPTDTPIAELPDAVLARLVNLAGESPNVLGERTYKSARSKLYEQPEILETVDGRDDVIYKESCNLWRERFRLHGVAAFGAPEEQTVVYERLWAWNRAKCKPPLDDEVIQEKCEGGRRYISEQVSVESHENGGPKYTSLGLEFRDGEWWPGQWQLTVIHSDPVVYKLHVPAWKEQRGSGGGDVILSVEDYSEHAKVAKAVLASTKVVVLDDLPGVWPQIWNGSKRTKDRPGGRGLKAKLIDAAKHEDSSPETKRSVVVASWLWDRVDRPVQPRDGAPDHMGRPTAMADGEVWLMWMKTWEEALRFGDVKQTEINELARRIGVTPKDYRWHPPRGPHRSRFLVLRDKHLRLLRALIEIVDEEPHQ